MRDFKRSLCPSGADDEIDESLHRLVAWAEESGRFYQELQALVEGGRKHDLIYDFTTATWLKFTKPSRAGYVISFEFGAPALEPGLPSEYLERLLLQNQVCSDQVTFVGIGEHRNHPTIISRQQHLLEKPADPSEFIQLMTHELCSELLPARFSIGYQDSLAFIRENIAGFDLRPANVVKTPDGRIIPIDSTPVRLDENAIAILTGI